LMLPRLAGEERGPTGVSVGGEGESKGETKGGKTKKNHREEKPNGGSKSLERPKTLKKVCRGSVT